MDCYWASLVVGTAQWKSNEFATLQHSLGHQKGRQLFAWALILRLWSCCECNKRMLENTHYTRTTHLTYRQTRARFETLKKIVHWRRLSRWEPSTTVGIGFVRISSASMFETLILTVDTYPRRTLVSRSSRYQKLEKTLPRKTTCTCFGWNSGESLFRLASPAKQSILNHNGWPARIKRRSRIEWKI